MTPTTTPELEQERDGVIRSSAWLACRAKEMRELCRLTRTEAAKKLGVSVSLVSLWEAGKRTISQPQMMHMAHTYGISLDFMLNATVIARFKMPELKPKRRRTKCQD
jgi:transcriptional regulator with XRE-family HTH domain